VRRLPRAALILLAVSALAVAGVTYQLARKPTELLAAVVPSAPKPPERTWEDYRPLFEAHATAAVSPELLAALAQAESGGDPLATPRWTFRWSTNPLDLYGPPSSAVGLLQMTDGNLAEARRLCVHDHEVARAGAWNDLSGCWLNGLYLRILPGDSVEMTSAFLDASIREIAARQRVRRLAPERVRRLAAVIHLCGRARGEELARRGFWILPGERCGDQDVALYIGRVEVLAHRFERVSGRPATNAAIFLGDGAPRRGETPRSPHPR
jgi:hypothetical protein